MAQMSLGGSVLDMLPNAANYRRTFIQMGAQRRSIYHNLITSHPGMIIRWELKFFLWEDIAALNSAHARGTGITFIDQDGLSYTVKILSYSHDGYFIPRLSEVIMTIETVSVAVF